MNKLLITKWIIIIILLFANLQLIIYLINTPLWMAWLAAIANIMITIFLLQIIINKQINYKNKDEKN